jgi:hypothetical protein
MMKRLFVLLYLTVGIAGQPVLAAEEGATDSAGSEQSAGQEPAPAGSDDAGSGEKKPAKGEEEEPECD